MPGIYYQPQVPNYGALVIQGYATGVEARKTIEETSRLIQDRQDRQEANNLWPQVQQTLDGIDQPAKEAKQQLVDFQAQEAAGKQIDRTAYQAAFEKFNMEAYRSLTSKMDAVMGLRTKFGNNPYMAQNLDGIAKDMFYKLNSHAKNLQALDKDLTDQDVQAKKNELGFGRQAADLTIGNMNLEGREIEAGSRVEAAKIRAGSVANTKSTPEEREQVRQQKYRSDAVSQATDEVDTLMADRKKLGAAMQAGGFQPGQEDQFRDAEIKKRADVIGARTYGDNWHNILKQEDTAKEQDAAMAKKPEAADPDAASPELIKKYQEGAGHRKAILDHLQQLHDELDNMQPEMMATDEGSKKFKDLHSEINKYEGQYAKVKSYLDKMAETEKARVDTKHKGESNAKLGQAEDFIKNLPQD